MRMGAYYSRPMRAWLKVAIRVRWGRLALLVCGGVALVVGLKAAWASNSGTIPLLVGGVLVALALLDAEELVLRHNESEPRLCLRQLEQAVRESKSLAATNSP